MFVYHVCAQKDGNFFDGIIQSDKKIISRDEYFQTKKNIAMKMNVENFELITILALSFLHEVD